MNFLRIINKGINTMEYEEFDPYESDGYAPDSDVCHGSPFVEVQIFIDEFDPFSDGSEPLPFIQ
jgi:hypothetical protein